jgi:hypothetical protein
LNGITHPRIILIMLKRILHASFGPVKILRAPTYRYFESGQLRAYSVSPSWWPVIPNNSNWSDCASAILTWTEQQCRDRIQSQRSIEAKVAMAAWLGIRGFECSSEVERARCHGAHLRVGMSLLQNAVARLGIAVTGGQFETVFDLTNIPYMSIPIRICTDCSLNTLLSTVMLRDR